MIRFNNLNLDELELVNEFFDETLEYYETLKLENKNTFDEFFNLFNEICKQRNQQQTQLNLNFFNNDES
jgi:hypothetical protein